MSCYKAGRDGFRLHRYLVSPGIENQVVDSSIIETNRRKRRAKTDRIDGVKLSGAFGVWCGSRVWRTKTGALNCTVCQSSLGAAAVIDADDRRGYRAYTRCAGCLAPTASAAERLRH